MGTLAVQAWPITDVRGYMGHADIQTTMVYVHHAPRATAAAELTRLVDAQTGLAPPEDRQRINRVPGADARAAG